jgi:hypothetical protein
METPERKDGLKVSKSAFGLAALVAAAGVVAVSHPPPARADCNTTECDQRFISMMVNHGISQLYPGTVANAGHKACTELAAGTPRMQVVLDTVGDNQKPSRATADWVVTGAQQIYCPGVG